MISLRLGALLVLFVCVSLSAAQYREQRPTPTPILKQINRHDQDGSYTYGYEAADGSFKIETKYPNGEVKGKYGFVDDTGKVREVEYGASRRGFEPAGDGIMVAPPTLHNNAVDSDYDQYDDGQYRESHHYSDSTSQQRNRYQPQTQYHPQTQFRASTPVQQHNVQPQGPAGSFTVVYGGQNPQQAARQTYQQPAPQQYHHAVQPQQHYAPAPQARSAAPPVPASLFRGHPASNIDIHTGSYTVSYSGK